MLVASEVKGIMIGIPPSLEDAIVFIFKDRKFFLILKISSNIGKRSYEITIVR